MKQSVVDADTVIRDRVFTLDLTQPFTFNTETLEDASATGAGPLHLQENPFFLFDFEIINSYRVGPTLIAPTRYEADLTITYMTKTPSTVLDWRLLETVAGHFAEQSIEQVRFRTFTPLTRSVYQGFTSYPGAIAVQYELYRGDRYGS